MRKKEHSFEELVIMCVLGIKLLLLRCLLSLIKLAAFE